MVAYQTDDWSKCASRGGVYKIWTPALACVALELCSSSLQTWIVFWMFLKGIKKLLRWGALMCNCNDSYLN